MASSTSFILLLLLLLPLAATAVQFDVVNQCSYIVWAAASPGGGQQLNPGQTWSFNVNPGTTAARVWARTGCSFDGNGNGHCETGDCGGRLVCQGYGASPNTLAEYALNQYMNNDFYDISVIDGFNVPMDFRPYSGNCQDLRCSADVNGQCPGPLRTSGGYCNNACPVFKTEEYCCNSGNCGPTDYSRYFKNLCPDAYSYPKDDTSTHACPSGSNYRVTFCP